MKKTFLALLLLICISSPLYAAQSTITEAEGYACMGDDKSRKQTEELAMTDARRKAAESASTYIKSETHVKDLALEKDLLSAYANATVKVIQEIERLWYKDSAAGDCCRIKVKADVIPDEKLMEQMSKDKRFSDDPGSPLTVTAWTNKKEYGKGEKIRIYMKGNKPFHAAVLYKDAAGQILQLLPNPYRKHNYFYGGVVYEIPSSDDRFDLEVTPPFGEEQIMVYASTNPLGDMSLEAKGGMYLVKTNLVYIAEKTRGVKLTIKKDGKQGGAEFAESTSVVQTKGK